MRYSTVTYQPWGGNMRTDRLLELADHIEGLKHFNDPDYEMPVMGFGAAPILPEQDRLSLFHMAWWQFQCHAPCCTAGWADFLWGEDESTSLDTRARLALDLDWNTALGLFQPAAPAGDGTQAEYISKLTPKVVARALRDLAETGEVVFELGEEA